MSASANLFSNIGRLIDQIHKDKGVERNIVVDSIIQGVGAAIHKTYGTYRDIEVQYNEESGEVEIFEFKEAVEDAVFMDEEVEIKLTEAFEYDPNVQIGDSVGVKIEINELGRVAAQLARQVIVQKVRNAESEVIFAEFEQRKGEVASGIVRRVERRTVVVDLGRTEAYMPYREQIQGEMFKAGDRVQGYIADVRLTGRGPQIIMSRSHNEYLRKLFESEVPEVADGIIEIKAISRDPGNRAKVAVYTNDSGIDPVGSCVGVKGSRVQNITQELRGEKIDIILWVDDIAQFVCKALSPADITKVVLDEAQNQMEVIVPDDQLSLAIGRRGMNVRLASRLTEWHLDICSESQLSARTIESLAQLMSLEVLSEEETRVLNSAGIITVDMLASSTVEFIASVLEIEDAKKTQNILDTAMKFKGKFADLNALKLAAKEAVGIQPSGKKSAEDLLKEEMKNLELSQSKEENPSKEEPVEAAKVGAEPEVEEKVENIVSEEGAKKN